MNKRMSYFLTQKLIGLLLLGLSVVMIFCGIGEPLILTVPLGFVALFSKKKVYVDEEYFFEDNEDERFE